MSKDQLHIHVSVIYNPCVARLTNIFYGVILTPKQTIRITINSLPIEKDYNYNAISTVSDEYFLAPLAIGQRAYVMVRCPSSVRPSVRPCINFFFKHLLRRNYLSDFDEISQKCSHHGPVQNFLK